MDPLLAIRDTLNEFAAALHLEEDELPPIFDASLMDHAQRLEDAVSSELSKSLAQRSVALRLTTKLLLEEPSPDAMALLLVEFQGLLVEMTRELRPHPEASEWHMARQFSEISEHLSGPKPAENQGFVELPRMLLSCDWVQEEFSKLAGAADVGLGKCPVARGFSKASAKRWMKRVGKAGYGQLSAAIDFLQNGIEFRARQVWYLRRTEGEDRSLAHMYVCAQADLFPDFHGALREHGLALEVAKLKGLAMGLQISEFSLCFETAEWMAQYALNYLVPPAPSDWGIRQPGQLSYLLRSRLSRWYFCCFEHRLEPLEMVASVLRIGRPLFYERVAAHALLEYSLLQGIAFTRGAAPFYLEALGALEREFSLMFDGYLLRHLHYPRLKTPQGWLGYLHALHDLHFQGGNDEDLEAYRHVFLTRRGLRSTMEILYRTTASHSALN